jgi:biotin carboxyl carrier protein
MQWQIKLDKKEYIVTLPRTIPDGIQFEAKVADKKEILVWHARRNTLCIVREGLEENLHFRSFKATKFPGDSTSNVQASQWRGQNSMTYNAGTAEQYVPGSANRALAKAAAGHTIRSQITGKILSVNVKKGDTVSQGDTLLIIEAMKMENKIFAPADGKVIKVSAKGNTAVTVGEELVKIE